MTCLHAFVFSHRCDSRHRISTIAPHPKLCSVVLIIDVHRLWLFHLRVCYLRKLSAIKVVLELGLLLLYNQLQYKLSNALSQERIVLDDTQLYVNLSHKNTGLALDKLNTCLNDVRAWMTSSKLKLNSDKTEFIVFRTQAQRNKLKIQFPLNIFGNLLQPANCVRNLGVLFDNDMSLNAHLQNICKGGFVQLRDFRRIRQFVFYLQMQLSAAALTTATPSSEACQWQIC